MYIFFYNNVMKWKFIRFYLNALSLCITDKKKEVSGSYFEINHNLYVIFDSNTIALFSQLKIYLPQTYTDY